MRPEFLAEHFFAEIRVDVVGYRNRRGFEFFDLFNQDGECLTEGEPFVELPTYSDVDAKLRQVLHAV